MEVRVWFIFIKTIWKLYFVPSRNGWNNNPTCLQFMHTFRKLLFSKIWELEVTIKYVLDATAVLKVLSTKVCNESDDILL
ncbi:hypothetical protein NQ317_019342 [Molorchus minor]|uniref:Transposable element P transposase-like RNase H C-terminal domain-containing protein n=1 Tax=Molorchus minor TaxID=1323400 RepID=A0ABQ9J1F8_9CUCU|nr:hypothetical protein NQ317_019342 [Molorchus minor]